MAEISLAARILLAVVFGVAALGKARHRASFRGTLLDLGFPPGVARLLTPLIIGCEALAVVLLASGIQRPLAALMAVGLLGVFGIFRLAHILRNALCFVAVSGLPIAPWAYRRSLDLDY